MRVVVVGGGTGGATFAGTLAAARRHDVVLLEAGPDFGPFDAHRWPFELLDSRRLPSTFDWGLENADPGADRRFPLARARVMGGCSSHNGCAAVRGLRGDFEGWAGIGGAFWRADAVLEDFAAVERALNVRHYAAEEVTPFQHAVHQAALATGIPQSADLNDIDEGPASAISPVNKRGGVRWNAAFGFLDPVRDGGFLSVIDRFTATELVLTGDRVTGVRGMRAGTPRTIEADAVVLAAGAYASPELLLRSGIGGAAMLRAAGVPVRHDLPGVGRNLQDHPCAVLEYRATDALIDRMIAFEQSAMAYDEAVIIKARSPGARTAVDLHIFSVGGRRGDGPGWYWQLWVALLAPGARGQVRPYRDDDGHLRFAIEHRQLTDPDGGDLAALHWGVGHARAIAAAPPLASLVTETTPGPAVTGDAIDPWIRATHLNYYHPAGTCPMGADPTAGAVTDGLCRVHGLRGLMVADASVMPVIVSANTNIPAAMIAHRLARHFDDLLAEPV